MTGRVIGKTEVITTLSAIVEREGANTERGCFYTTTNDKGDLVPWCIAGCAFFEWGIPVEKLKNVGDLSVYGLARNWPWDDVITLTEPAAEVLNYAQAVQDSGKPWGHVLERAQTRAAVCASAGES